MKPEDKGMKPDKAMKSEDKAMKQYFGKNAAARVRLLVFALVAVVIMAGGCTLFNKGDDLPTDPMVIEITAGGSDGDDSSNKADAATIPDEDDADAADAYVNDPIGISIMVQEDWSTSESETFPDELLGLYYRDDEICVWIDRYPKIKVEQYKSGKYDMFTTYKAGLDGEVTEITLEEAVVKESGTWDRTVFILKTGQGDQYIDLYMIDMPNGRGALLYAVITSVAGGHPAYKEAIEMLDSLRFTR
ncbi:MAG: hypothetical protein FWG03_00655 [Clostridiales bacterium]|nr:hypothetical protein [Clostridiales bacterium]